MATPRSGLAGAQKSCSYSRDFAGRTKPIAALEHSMRLPFAINYQTHQSSPFARGQSKKITTNQAFIPNQNPSRHPFRSTFQKTRSNIFPINKKGLHHNGLVQQNDKVAAAAPHDLSFIVMRFLMHNCIDYFTPNSHFSY